ncbi:MAG: transcriptional regulator [Methanobrevibacter sp.]|nr:transcriptional regulator [Methanobrevibacter sp.]
MEDNNEDIYKIVGYVMASDYRTNILKCIGKEIKIPSAIAEEVGLRTNHVSNVLKDLKEKNLVVCLNKEAKKGRLYKNTELGLQILEYI